MADEKKISGLTQATSAEDMDEFVVVNKSVTEGQDAGESGQTSKITFGDLKTAIGTQGQKGEPGTNGANGTDGNDGAKGQKGQAGSNGTNGTNGTDGAKGQKGQTGLASNGAKGQKGQAGSNGTNGNNGDKGQKGQAGSNGTHGTDGTDGKDGDKGQKGQTGTGDKGQKGQAGTNALNSSGKLVINNSNLATRTHASTLPVDTFPTDRYNELVINTEATDQLMWIGRRDLDYNAIIISNNSLTSKGSKIQLQAHRHVNGLKADTAGERYLAGTMQIQTIPTTTDDSNSYTYAPRMALTYQNFNAQAMSPAPNAVTNIFIDGGRLRGYSSFALPTHVTTFGQMSLGGADHRWKQLWATQASNTDSDARKKTDITMLDDIEKKVAVKAKSLIRKYRLKESISRKGTEKARHHVGIIAQDLIKAFEDEGLNAFDYSLMCRDIYYVNPEDPTDTTTEEVDGWIKHDDYSIKYEELFAFIISAL